MVNCISRYEEDYMLSVHRQLDIRYTYKYLEHFDLLMWDDWSVNKMDHSPADFSLWSAVHQRKPCGVSGQVIHDVVIGVAGVCPNLLPREVHAEGPDPFDV